MRPKTLSAAANAEHPTPDFLALQIERRKSRERLIHCANGCKRNGDSERKAASHIAWVIGRPTYLCANCAKDWPALWANALTGVPEPSKPPEPVLV